MRRVTRNAVLLILGVVVALLALGALPTFLASGDPYYLTAEPLDGAGNGSVNGTASVNESAAVNGSDLSERQYPYTTQALRNGTSDPYRKGPWGIKESFTHSPFDEVDALTARDRTALGGDGAVVSYNGTLYSVAVSR